MKRLALAAGALVVLAAGLVGPHESRSADAAPQPHPIVAATTQSQGSATSSAQQKAIQALRAAPIGAEADESVYEAAYAPVTLPRGSMAVQRAAAKRDRIEIPALRVVMPLVKAPLDRKTRQIRVPSLTKVGWVSPGPRPGAKTGNVVLVNHRDSMSAGRGVRSPAYKAGSLRAGVAIVLYFKHRTYRYSVTTAKVVKSIPGSAWDDTGDGRLGFLTCGGKIKKTAEDRWVWTQKIYVTARLDTPSGRAPPARAIAAALAAAA